MPPDIKHEFKLGMRRTHGASMLQQHFTYLLKNPALHPSVREALTRETEVRSVKSGETLQHGKAEDAEVLRGPRELGTPCERSEVLEAGSGEESEVPLQLLLGLGKC